jgi:malate/lactate dehydrogenase
VIIVVVSNPLDVMCYVAMRPAGSLASEALGNL